MSRKAQDGTSARPVFDMAAPNQGLPYRGRLRELCKGKTKGPHCATPSAFADPGHDAWLDAATLERFLAADSKIARSCRNALEAIPPPIGSKASPAEIAKRDRLIAKAQRKVERGVDRIFNELMLVDIVERFDRVRPLVAQYMIARAAAKAAHPSRFPDDK